MDEEGVAEINRPSLPSGQHFFATRGRSEAISGQFAKREAVLSGREQLPRNCAVRTFPDFRRSIQFPDIGEKEQHKQGAAPALDVDPPLHEVGVIGTKAGINVPSHIPGLVRGREAHREGAQAVGLQPAALADQGIVALKMLP